jgi:hypothetical protein
MTLKPFASLSSGLLARKGQAKPAMRPQGFGHFGGPNDDLGWNDMGFDAPRPAPPPHRPAVVQQQEELTATFEPEFQPELLPEPELVPPAPVVAPQSAPAARTAKAVVQADGRRAAFTLRLDAERHLRLRLASAVSLRSSQQLVIEALDALLGSIPGLDDLTAKAKKGG